MADPQNISQAASQSQQPVKLDLSTSVPVNAPVKLDMSTSVPLNPPPKPPVSAGGRGRALIGYDTGGPIFADVPPGQEASTEAAARSGMQTGGTIGLSAVMAPAILSDPLLALGSLGGGYLGGKALGGTAKLLGADPDIQALYEGGGNLLGGLLGGMGVSGIRSLMRPTADLGRGAPSMFSRTFGRTVPESEVAKVPLRGQFQPALANTPQEVLQYANAKGIDFTPGQATGAGFPQRLEAISERSITGQPMVDARTANAEKLMANVRDIADKADPFRLGTSEEAAGESIQQAAKTAQSVAQENAAVAYKQVGIDQANLAGDVSDLTQFAHDQQYVRQPGAAVARREYQSPTVQAALDDIGGAEARLGKNPSIQSMRNLRTEMWEKGNDYSGNIPDSARALYKQAAGMVDADMMKAAQGTPFEDSFRDASAQWKAIQQKYNDPASPLSRILKQQDPAKITRDLLNRGSANDVKILQNEGMDSALEPLKRQVIEDVAKQGFRVGSSGLGGYSDSFLQQLFGPQGAKELYLNADIARRFSFQVNPSGTSNVMLAEKELTGGIKNLLIGPIATRASMPRPAGSFLPKTVPMSSLANPTMFGPTQP